VRALALLVTTTIALSLSAAALVAQEISLSAPDSAPLNSMVEVTWTGPDAPGDYIVLGNADGKPIPYASYAYTAKSGGTVTIRLPEKSGNYTIAYANKQKETLHFVPIMAEPVSATLAAPDRVPAASAFTVAWTGPDNEGDHVAIGNAAGSRIPYSSYAYTAQYPEQ
jgi:Ca-activated chloride channel homolog